MQTFGSVTTADPTDGRHAGTRLFGLDVLRAFAGIMVVIVHTAGSISPRWRGFPPLSAVDWVDLFFVLSGYLIGGMLLDATQAAHLPLGLRCVDFLQRRWLRSLPNYYLFLVINIGLVIAGIAPGIVTHATWAYAVFMQNMVKPLDLFFWGSWSLAVEEWFYLLFPLLVFGGMRLLRLSGERAFLLTCVLFILLPTCLRIHWAPTITTEPQWSLWIRRSVPTRLDAPGFGMLLAWVHRRWPLIWRRSRWPAFLAGIALLVGYGHHIYAVDPWFAKYVLETLSPVSVALLFPLLATWRSGGRATRAVRMASMLSFALYLVHMPMYFLFGHLIADASPLLGVLRYLGFLTAVALVSYAVYRWWERPFMDRRDAVGRWLERRWTGA